MALILPHKAMLGFNGGAIGADIYCDRTGILAKSLGDCAKVLDALKDPDTGYYDPRDVYTTVPRARRCSRAAMRATRRPRRRSSGMRIGIVRESMRLRPGDKAAEPISRAAAAEIKTMLGQKLGATLVESGDPDWECDPDIEQMTIDFRAGLARLVPVFMPDILFRLGRDGTPLFKEFAAAIRRTEFQPGKFFGEGKMAPIDYCVALTEGRIAPPKNLDIAIIQDQELAMSFRFHIPQYRAARRTGPRAGSTKASTISPSSTPARNSGVMTAAPPSRTGRRSKTRATPLAAGKESTSASCCASSCAGSTCW